MDTNNDNNSFSSNNENKETNFQTANIIHKMKKIKKNKKKKQNIQNIEEFDILTNDNTSQETKEKEKEIKKEPSFFDKIRSFLKLKKDYIESFEDHEYEGKDYVTDPERFDDSFILKSIHKIYNDINSFNTYIAEKVLIISNGTHSDNDVTLIRNFIVLIECSLFSYVAVYNWIFLMFYADENHIKIPRVSVDGAYEFINPTAEEKEKRTSTERTQSGLLKMFLFFFDVALWFPQQVETLILDVFPGITGWFLNGPLIFIIVFLIIFYCSKKFAITIRDFYTSLLSNNKSNNLINLMYALTFILFILFAISYYSVTSVFGICVQLLRMMFVMILSVPCAALYIGLYLLIYSLFAIPIFGWKEGVSFQKVHDYITNRTSGFEDDDSCLNSGRVMGIIYALLRQLCKITDFVKDKLLLILYFVISLYAATDLTKALSIKMENRTILIILSMGITLIIGVLLYISIIAETKDFSKLNKVTDLTDKQKEIIFGSVEKQNLGVNTDQNM